MSAVTGAGHPLPTNLFPTVSPRILSIQSYTAHGYVGNKAVVFPLQCFGYNVDAIHTVSLSNHPGYVGGCKGSRLSMADFQNMVDGLSSNNLLNHDVICSGYTSSSEIIVGIEETVRAVRLKNPDLLYFLDPVLGDLGKYYVPIELVDSYKRNLLPLASVITPNQFESEVLSGIKIDSLSDAIDACMEFHNQYGIKTCVLKGLKLKSEEIFPSDSYHSIVISRQISPSNYAIYRKIVPTIDRNFSGCGDLYSAMMINFLHKYNQEIDNDHSILGNILDASAAAISSVLKITNEKSCKELCIIESCDIFRNVFEATRSGLTPSPSVLDFTSIGSIGQPAKVVKGHSGNVAGIIFDMDGTLTEAGAIDFNAMYTRTGLCRSPTTDIVELINSMDSSDDRKRAFEIIVEEEMKGCERMKVRSDFHTVITAIQKAKISTAISTRNCEEACHKFISMTKLEGSIFSPVISRDSLDGINKPDPRVGLHILKHWGYHHDSGVESDGNEGVKKKVSFNDFAGNVWFVGDSIDDMKCGKGSGCKTCYIITEGHEHIPSKHPDLIDLAVHSLSEFADAIGLQV